MDKVVPMKMRYIWPFMLPLLGGCTAVEEWERQRATPVIDSLVDGAYTRMCDLRYQTEQRFMARKQLSSKTITAYCKRLEEPSLPES